MLTVMCGGDEADCRAEPVIAAYARSCQLMGGPGSGQLTKMVNQICIAGIVQALSEGLHFAELAGLDQQLVVETAWSIPGSASKFGRPRSPLPASVASCRPICSIKSSRSGSVS